MNSKDLLKKDHYAVLGVAPTASPEVIKAAHRALVRKYHPDVAGPEGAARTEEINTAYEYLTDPVKRASVDLSLAQAQAERDAAVAYAARTKAASRSTPHSSHATGYGTQYADYGTQYADYGTQYADYGTQYAASAFNPTQGVTLLERVYVWTPLTWFFAIFASVMFAFTAAALHLPASVSALFTSQRATMSELDVTYPPVLVAFGTAMFLAGVFSTMAPHLPARPAAAVAVCIGVGLAVLAVWGVVYAGPHSLVFAFAAALVVTAGFTLRLRPRPRVT